MLQMSWPKMAVIANRPASSAYGPESPHQVHQPHRDRVGGARLDHRRGQRDHGAHQHDRGPVDAPVGALDGQHAQQRPCAIAASRPATTGGTMPVASSTTIARQDRDRLPRPGPMGTAWRRTTSGESTASTIRPRAACVSSASHEPWSSSTSPAASVAPAAGPRVGDARAPHCQRRPGRRRPVTMPGNTCRADERRSGRDQHLREARSSGPCSASARSSGAPSPRGAPGPGRAARARDGVHRSP